MQRTLTQPADVIAAIPHLVGFTPEPTDIVVLGFTGDNHTLTGYFNIDEAELTITRIDAEHHDITHAMIVGYGTHSDVKRHCEELVPGMTDSGVTTVDILHTDNHTWTSLLGQNRTHGVCHPTT